jgi:hypothetical protein
LRDLSITEKDGVQIIGEAGCCFFNPNLRDGYHALATIPRNRSNDNSVQLWKSARLTKKPKY